MNQSIITLLFSNQKCFEDEMPDVIDFCFTLSEYRKWKPSKYFQYLMGLISPYVGTITTCNVVSY